jgi:hypothetical protein
MLRLVFRRKAASRPGSVGVVLMELGQGLIERGEAGRVGAREMPQLGVDHLAVADDPGHRHVDRAPITLYPNCAHRVRDMCARIEFDP